MTGGGPQAELLRRVAHWLMKEPALEENALTAQVANGRLTIERRSTDPAPPGDVTVTDPDGKTQTLKLAETGPGRAAAGVAATTPGVWQASDGKRTAYAAAGAANPLEIADLRATASLVGKLAREFGRRCALAGHCRQPGYPGAAPDRAGSWCVRQFVGRAGATARSPGDRHCRAGTAAVLDRSATDAGPDGWCLAARGDVGVPSVIASEAKRPVVASEAKLPRVTCEFSVEIASLRPQ